MPFFDYECVECGHQLVDVQVSNWRDAGSVRLECPFCHVMMCKKAGAPAFFMVGYTAKNGYSGGK